MRTRGIAPQLDTPEYAPERAFFQLPWGSVVILTQCSLLFTETDEVYTA